MSSHPVNLAFRFLLELSLLLALGAWGWRRGEGWLRFVLALGVPVVAAVLWGTFRVPDDASHSGKAPIPVPGILRLALEVALFACAAWALHNIGATMLSWTLGIGAVVHYVISYDRVLWLITK